MSPASYGTVGTIITVLDLEYMFLSNGARQSLAKELSLKRYDRSDLIKKTVYFQLVVIAFFFAVNYLGSPVFSYLLDDASLDLYFKISAFLIPANGLFVILLGINDGLQQFGISALLGTVYPIAKLSAIPLVIFVFRSSPVIGVEAGFLFALIITIIFGCALLFVSKAKLKSTAHKKIPFSEVVHHTLSFSFFFIVVSLVLSIDTLVVKGVVHPPRMAGYYTGAVNFGKISYYLMSAFVTVSLPVISHYVGENRLDKAAARARTIITISLAFVLPITVIISASSGELLTAFYSSGFSQAAGALTFLSLSNFFMGITVLLNMIINSHLGSRFSDILSGSALIVVIPLFYCSAKFGGITAIALTSMICTGVLMIVSAIRVKHDIANIMTGKSWLLLALSGVLWIIVRLLVHLSPLHNLIILAAVYMGIYVVYIAFLLLTRIISITMIKSEE